MHNPFLINFINEGQGIIKYKGKIFKDKKYCILELASKYNLFKYIESTGKFKETHCKVIFKKILKGIKAMHSKDIYHLDIKLENILLDEKFEPKITDFGLSQKKEETLDGFLKGKIGTQNYMPPQMFLSNTKFKPIKADIFSLGVVLFTLSAGVNGFWTAEDNTLYKYIKENTEKSKENYWNVLKGKNIELSPSLQDLYIRMVSFNEDNRPSIDEILEDKWFKDIDKLNDEERNKLEQDIYSEFEKREKIVKEDNQQTVTNDTIKENRSKESNSDNIEKKFDKQEAKDEEKGMIMEYFIRIDRDLNPVNYMNKLINIIRFYEADCDINASKKNLKFNVVFNAKGIEEEPNDDDDKLTLYNKRIYKKLIIQIKLFKAINGKYKLRFTKKEGDISNFFYKLKDYMSYAKMREILND